MIQGAMSITGMGGLNANGAGPRLISSELNSYQSEKKIGGNSNEHHYNSGGRAAGVG